MFPGHLEKGGLAYAGLSWSEKNNVMVEIKGIA